NISAQQPINDAGSQMRIFESVLQHIQNDYVDEPNLEKVRNGALRGLANGLDPYSSYLTADQVKDYQAKKGVITNLTGAQFSQASGYLYIISVVKDSPAAKAGLKSGDFVEYIENRATRDVSLYDAKQLLHGDAGTQVKMRVLRAGAKPQTIVLTRGTYKSPEPESRIETGKVGVIKFNSLDEGTAESVKTQVQNLQKQGVTKIVLDLREVALGTIKEGVAVANLFIKEGTLAQILGKEGKVAQTFAADPAKFLFDGKVAVLIDLGTAGASEVVASAILEKQRGEVIGERSFGAGTEQQLFTLRGGDGLLLTTSKWASANGKAFLGEDRQNTGIKPTIEVKPPDEPEPIDPEELSEQSDEPSATPSPTPKVEPKKVEDVQLKKALEVLADKVATATAK
ncbi:MAG: S41 family peptidase, partial [Pyrinomonadaceae bacterium]|nr:S41 family peptidase [Pyrinomonadaceae bacterium]